MDETFLIISESLGIPVGILVIFLIWSLTWKLLALWKAARKNSVAWFIALAVVNTMGVFEILYIFLFSKIDAKVIEKAKKSPVKKKVVKKKIK